MSTSSGHHGAFYYDVFKTPVAWVGILACGKGLARLSLGLSSERACKRLLAGITEAIPNIVELDSARRQIKAYFKGDMIVLSTITLDFGKTPPFYRRAWTACAGIPPGQTRSYAWLAEATGYPGAFRAAGQAMAKNPLALVIPCHRVISSNGQLGGYSAGLEIKAELLELERRAVTRL